MAYIGKKPADKPLSGSDIADDIIDSQHYAAGSIDNEHIADDAIDSEHYATGSIDNEHIADDAVDSEHYAAGSIDNEHLADDAVGIDELSATGTASSSTFLRGDNTWAAASGTITALNSATENELVTVGSTTTELDAEANLTFDGTDLTIGAGDIVFGTAGKGICLGVTSNTDANTLDDYEEGTFTPSMTIETGSVTLSTATGYYLKIGSLVWVYCHMVVSAHSGGHADNAWLWSGLPFTNSTNMDNIPIRVYASGLTATTNGLTGYIDNNQTSGRIGAQTTGLSNASLLIQNSLGVYISGTYHV